MIIFNEKEYSKYLIETCKFTRKKRYELQLICNYYREEGMNDFQLESVLNNICLKCFKNYIPTSPQNIKMIADIIHYSQNKKLKSASEIVITEDELSIILKEENKKIQKLMFVYLVLAKYYMSLNNTKDYYVGCEDKDIFNLCDMYIRKQEKLDYMHYLTKKGYIKPTLSMSSIVNYVNENSKVIMKFIPDEDMVFHLEKYLGGFFINCSECGKLVKKTNNKIKYCNRCSKTLKNH